MKRKLDATRAPPKSEREVLYGRILGAAAVEPDPAARKTLEAYLDTLEIVARIEELQQDLGRLAAAGTVYDTMLPELWKELRIEVAAIEEAKDGALRAVDAAHIDRGDQREALAVTADILRRQTEVLQRLLDGRHLVDHRPTAEKPH